MQPHHIAVVVRAAVAAVVEEFSTEEKKEKLCFLFRPFKQTIFLNIQTETNEQTNNGKRKRRKKK